MGNLSNIFLGCTRVPQNPSYLLSILVSGFLSLSFLFIHQCDYSLAVESYQYHFLMFIVNINGKLDPKALRCLFVDYYLTFFTGFNCYHPP